LFTNTTRAFLDEEDEHLFKDRPLTRRMQSMVLMVNTIVHERAIFERLTGQQYRKRLISWFQHYMRT
jgi:hypothetical protein